MVLLNCRKRSIISMILSWLMKYHSIEPDEQTFYCFLTPDGWYTLLHHQRWGFVWRWYHVTDPWMEDHPIYIHIQNTYIYTQYTVFLVQSILFPIYPPRKFGCHLKWDHPKRAIHLPSIFRGHVSFRGATAGPGWWLSAPCGALGSDVFHPRRSSISGWLVELLGSKNPLWSNEWGG